MSGQISLLYMKTEQQENVTRDGVSNSNELGASARTVISLEGHFNFGVVQQKKNQTHF